MGDRVYYYRKDSKNRRKYFIRSAPVSVAQTSATKKAAVTFGIASKNSSLIRKALHEYTQHCYDNTLHYRLNKALLTDDLLHFKFNKAAAIQYHPVIEQTNSTDITISFPDLLKLPGNTTHLRIKAIGLSVNFAKSSTRQLESNTVVIKRGEACAPLTLHLNRRQLSLIVLEIQSFYEVNGQLCVSRNRKAQLLDLIAVLPPVGYRKKTKTKCRNTVPRFWLPYITPAKQSLIIKRVYNSLPEG